MANHKDEFQTLLRERDAARKKVNEYVNLVTTLSNELDFLHKNICFTCRWRFAPTQSSSRFTSHPLLRRLFRPSHQRLPAHILPTNSTTTAPKSQSITPVDEQTNYVLLPRNQSIDSDSESGKTTSSPADTEKNEHSINNNDTVVTYNPQVERKLSISIAHAFTFETMVLCANFSPNGKYLAVGLECGRTCIYDIETCSKICVLADRSLKEETGIRTVKFSPTNEYIATGGSDHQIRIWKIAQKRVRAMLKGHTALIISLVFSPDSRSLISSSYDQSLRIWSTRDGSLQRTIDHTSFFFSVSMSREGRYVTAANMDGTLRIWDVRTGRMVMCWMGHGENVWSTMFVPDGKGLVSGSQDRTMKYWDVGDLDSMRMNGIAEGTGTITEKKEILTFEGHTSCINTLAISPDSRWILSGSDDRTVRIWDARNGIWQCILQGWHDDDHEFVLVVDFSPDVEGVPRFLTGHGGQDSRVVLWQI